MVCKVLGFPCCPSVVVVLFGLPGIVLDLDAVLGLPRFFLDFSLGIRLPGGIVLCLIGSSSALCMTDGWV